MRGAGPREGAQGERRQRTARAVRALVWGSVAALVVWRNSDLSESILESVQREGVEELLRARLNGERGSKFQAPQTAPEEGTSIGVFLVRPLSPGRVGWKESSFLVLFFFQPLYPSLCVSPPSLLQPNEHL